MRPLPSQGMSMKINWGTGIVISFVLFISFIVFLVLTMINSSNHELVTKDYYQKELAYQDEIDAEENANVLSEKIIIEKTKEGLSIIFPKEFEPQKLTGSVSFYRPSNQKLDFDLPINVSNSKLRIPEKNMVEGLWKVSVLWKYNNISFLHKEEIRY